MVTSFRPKNPHLPDDTMLATVRGISDLSELYYGFGEYRLQMLEERIRCQLKKLQEAHRAGKRLDSGALKKFLAEQEAFLAHTNKEMVPEKDVVPGHQPELGIPDVKLPPSPSESPSSDSAPATKKAKVA